MADTRAGFWLLVIVARSPPIVTIRCSPARPPTGRRVALRACCGRSLLLPVLGILLVTSEWSQRTALTTFALVPSAGA